MAPRGGQEVQNVQSRKSVRRPWHHSIVQNSVVEIHQKLSQNPSKIDAQVCKTSPNHIHTDVVLVHRSNASNQGFLEQSIPKIHVKSFQNPRSMEAKAYKAYPHRPEFTKNEWSQRHKTDSQIDLRAPKMKV